MAEKHNVRALEACEAFLLSVDTPDAESLERIIERFPDCAAELTDFAIEWAAQDLHPSAPAFETDWDDGWDEVSWSEESLQTTSAVESAMDRLRQRLGEPTDPFAGLSATDLRGIAARLGLDTPLLAKLRHRRLVPETVPMTLRLALADVLGSGLAALTAHLEAPPLLPSGAAFKSAEQPDPGRQESFAEAVARSSVAEDARRRWLG